MILIFLVLGLIVGSFLNVVVHRFDLAESIFLSRSHCPSCKHQIAWYDNIPVISFLLLKMRCRSCQESISWQYPFVEMLTGVVFMLVGYYFFDVSSAQTWIETLFYLTIFSMLIVIVGYDTKFMEIPMLMVWLSISFIIALLIFQDWTVFDGFSGKSFWSFNLTSGLLGGMIAAAFFYFLVFVSKEKWMGMGDVYIGFVVGLLAGFPDVFLSLMIAFTSGSIFGIILIVLKRSTLKTQVPFAPFLILSGFVTVFLAQKIDIIHKFIWPIY
ncbi:prepilin peptidase [Patescibacteria group bacterium]